MAWVSQDKSSKTKNPKLRTGTCNICMATDGV